MKRPRPPAESLASGARRLDTLCAAIEKALNANATEEGSKYLTRAGYRPT